jgi:hypothetical protein
MRLPCSVAFPLSIYLFHRCCLFLQWGTPGTFPQLSTLGLDSNRLNGTLPAIWGSPRAMTYLRELYLQDNLMSGGLPASWGTPNGMPSLGFFSAGNNQLGGERAPPDEKAIIAGLRAVVMRESCLSMLPRSCN